MAQLERVRTTVLDIAYEHAGPADAFPIVLMHGFPYDPRAFDEVIPPAHVLEDTHSVTAASCWRSPSTP